MPERTTAVALEDLAEVLEHLEALALVLEHLQETQVGVHEDSDLLDELLRSDFKTDAWQPLRHQLSVGNGWEAVAERIGLLRDRLLLDYGRGEMQSP